SLLLFSPLFCTKIFLLSLHDALPIYGVKAVDPFEQIKDIDIRTILYNSSGSAPALFVGTAAFELIVKQQIKRFEEPSLKCVSLVDRKSSRLNSSHVAISYAVFCLKKK